MALTLAERAAYAAAQAARVGWYFGHYALGRRLLKPMPKPQFPVGPTPQRAALMAALRDLFRQDLANIEAGHYALPLAGRPDPFGLIAKSLHYFRDLPQVDRRRQTGAAQEPEDDPAFAHLPRYFRQNFHYQSDGYLSDHSAGLYDTQVEVLFTGAADAMRRQALVPIAQFAHARRSRALALLDIGCGTGRFLRMVKDNWPMMAATGVDLSQPYLERARAHLRRHAIVDLREAAAEALPFDNGAFDIVASTFVLHELPATVRAKALAEMARVVKPGGLVVILESLQKGDRPDWDGLLDLFPHVFHEPYYKNYVDSDLAQALHEAGLEPAPPLLAFLAKVVAATRL
jgi:ubiquinone/menaquinone biosynthesis C-methylase UbiE